MFKEHIFEDIFEKRNLHRYRKRCKGFCNHVKAGNLRRGILRRLAKLVFLLRKKIRYDKNFVER